MPPRRSSRLSCCAHSARPITAGCCARSTRSALSTREPQVVPDEQTPLPSAGAVRCRAPRRGLRQYRDGNSEREDMLAEAGFALKKANTPQRIATLKALPPHRFVQRGTGGGAKYFYGDPTLCGCIYVGDQNAYDRYRQNMAARQTATDEQIRSVLSSAPLPGESGL